MLYETLKWAGVSQISIRQTDALAIAAFGLLATFATHCLVRRHARLVAAYQKAEIDRTGLADVVEQAFDSIVITDNQGRIEYVNPAFTLMTGYSAAEVAGASARVLKSGLQDQAFYAGLWNTIRGGKVWQGELVNRRKDGTLCPVSMTITPVRDNRGAIRRYIAIQWDVSARRAAQETQSLLASIVESSEDAIVTATLDGTIKTWNHGSELLYGYKAEEVIGRSMDMLVPSYRMRAFREVASGCAQRGERVPPYVAMGLRKDGTQFYISASVVPIKNTAGQVTTLAAIVRDISALKSAELAMASLASIVECTEDAIFSATLEGTILTWNRGAEKLYGYQAAEIAGKSLSILAPPDRYQEQAEVLRGLQRGEGVSQLETQTVKADGSLVDVSITVSPVRNPGGEIVRCATIARDISGRKRAEAALRLSEEKYRSLVANIPDIIWTANAAGEPVFASPSCLGICGYTSEEICRPGAWTALIHPEDLPRYQAAIHTMQAACDGQSKESQRYEQTYRIRRKDGEWIWVHSRTTGVYEMHGEPYFDGVLSDITERKQLEQSLAHQATHDALTGLPNLQVFGERCQQALALARRLDKKLALLHLDLDRFKMINDTLGHSSGDHLLHLAARRLKGCLRDSEVLARGGGDEFMLLLNGEDDPQIAPRIAERMLGALSAPFPVGGRDISLSASIGIAFYPDDGQDLLSLQRSADAAMFEAKRQGRNRFQTFTPAMGAALSRRLAVETELHGAVERDEFSLHFQPKIDLMTGGVAGVEALLRWTNRQLGGVSPSEFIPIAEASGLIMPIARWVLGAVCRQERAWRQAGCDPVQIAVNISAAQFAGGGLPGIVARALAETATDPSRLDLEVTEGAIMFDVQEAARQLAELKQLGVSISLDDFGTGYSSLSYLACFPIDTLKIDQSFIRRMNDAESTNAIIIAIVKLAHGLGMRTIAEGVESQRDLESLKAMGCDLAQGFLLGHPVHPDLIAQMLTMQGPLPVDGAAMPGYPQPSRGGVTPYAEPRLKPVVN